jgi:GNAT superfamily N-acetyltransferase
MAAGAAAVTVRPATEADLDQIYAFIVDLATYEREPAGVTGTVEMLRDALFGRNPVAEALVAEVDGESTGFAIYHGTFSTWECLPGIWLEDLFVPESRRGTGAGRALLAAVARAAIERGCPRLEWHALDWNEPALGFYRRIGAERMSEWELHRLTGETLREVAAGTSPVA